MIAKSILTNALYFDLETAGQYKDFKTLQTKNPRLADLWIKRCKWIKQNSHNDDANKTPDELYYDKSSLHPEFGQIVCATFGVFNEDGQSKKIASYTGNEYDILISCNKFLERSKSQGWKLAGHTIKNFDIPFMGKRMIYSGINPSSVIQVWNKKPWETSFLDISDTVSFGSHGQSFTSLDLITCCLNVDSPKNDISGADVHKSFWDGDIDRIKIYCEKDVEAVMDAFKGLCFDI